MLWKRESHIIEDEINMETQHKKQFRFIHALIKKYILKKYWKSITSGMYILEHTKLYKMNILPSLYSQSSLIDPKEYLSLSLLLSWVKISVKEEYINRKLKNPFCPKAMTVCQQFYNLKKCKVHERFPSLNQCWNESYQGSCDAWKYMCSQALFCFWGCEKNLWLLLLSAEYQSRPDPIGRADLKQCKTYLEFPKFVSLLPVSLKNPIGNF